MEGLSGQAAAVERGWLRRESSGVSNSRWGGVVGVGALRLSERWAVVLGYWVPVVGGAKNERSSKALD